MKSKKGDTTRTNMNMMNTTTMSTSREWKISSKNAYRRNQVKIREKSDKVVPSVPKRKVIFRKSKFLKKVVDDIQKLQDTQLITDMRDIELEQSTEKVSSEIEIPSVEDSLKSIKGDIKSSYADMS